MLDIACGFILVQGNIVKLSLKRSEFIAISSITMIYILLWLWIPTPSFWGVDNGIKFQGARSFSETGSIRIPYSGISFDSEGIYRPLIPPFGVMSKKGQIPTFSVPFMLVAGMFYSLFGQSGPHLFSFLGGIACLIAGLMLWKYQRPNRDATAYLIILGLGSPLLFYSLTLWEHSWAMALVMFSYLLLFRRNTRTLNTNKGYINLAIAGVLIGISVTIRTETVMWIVLTAVYWQQTGRRWRALIPYLSGVFIIFILTLLINAVYTDRFLPMHMISNMEFHKLSNVVDLFLSRIDNMYVALLSGFSNNLFSLFGLIPLIIVVYRNKWRHYKVMWYLLTALIFIVWSYYWLEVMNATNRPAHMAISGGLFWVIPLATLAVTKFKKEKRHFIKFIWYAIGLYVILYVISSPKASGIHWGPRLIVTAVPLILLLATVRLHNWWRGIRQARYLIGLLVLLSVWGQAYSVQTLYTVRSENEKMNSWIVETGPEPIVTMMWWLAGDCGLNSDRVPWYTIVGTSQLKLLVNQFQSDGIQRFNYVEIPPYVNDKQWNSIGVEKLGVDYFRERDGRVRRSHLRIINSR